MVFDIHHDKLFKFYIFILAILNINSYQFFKAYTLLSKDILFITEEGIIKYLIESDNQITITPIDVVITDSYELDFISFDQSDEGNYILCRINNYIYIISNEENTVIISKEISIIEDFIVDIKYYKYQNNNYFIISFINIDGKIQIQKYEFNTDDISLINNVTKEIPNEEGIQGESLDNGISCELMYVNGYSNNVLICFVENYSNLLIALEFDPENDLSFINNTINNKENEGTYDIKTIISPNKQICLICYTKANFECILYDSKRKLFSDSVILSESFQGIYSDFDLNYVKDTNEYYIYVAPSTEEILFFRYDEYFKIKEKSNDNNCYTKYTINNFQAKYSSVII